MTIKNETIKKLNSKELGDLGLLNHGIYTYKGTLKSRLKGFKVTFNTADEVHFESETCRYEVIKTADIFETGETGYAIRLFDKTTDEYRHFWSIIFGCQFFK